MLEGMSRVYFLKFDHVDFSYYSNTGEIQVLQDRVSR